MFVVVAITTPHARGVAEKVESVQLVICFDLPEWNEFLDSASPINDCVSMAAEDSSMIIYTSGTTCRRAKPKG